MSCSIRSASCSLSCRGIIRSGSSSACRAGLAGGNGVAVKHAGNVQQCAAAFVSVLEDAGVPPGLACNLRVEAAEVAGIIADHRIAAITLTGSTGVGRIVCNASRSSSEKAGFGAGWFRSFYWLADADVELAAKTAVKARFQMPGKAASPPSASSSKIKWRMPLRPPYARRGRPYCRRSHGSGNHRRPVGA